MSLEQSEARGKRLEASEAFGPGRLSVAIQFAGLAVTLDQSGAAYLSGHGTLIVSDLHLEKGSNAAARGGLIPAFDSHDTLERLNDVIGGLSPQTRGLPRRQLS